MSTQVSQDQTVWHKGVEYKIVRHLRSCCRRTQLVVQDPKTGKQEVISVPRK